MKTKKASKIVSKILSLLGQILLILVILVCIPLTVPNIFGYGTYNVVSGSMEPAIKTGSLVYVKKIEPAQVAVGDVIAFYSPNNTEMVITHRVVDNQSAEAQFITKGDANETEDTTPIPYTHLIGKVEVTIPYMGNLLAGFVSENGKIAVVGVVAVSVLLQIISSLISKIGEKKKA